MVSTGRAAWSMAIPALLLLVAGCSESSDSTPGTSSVTNAPMMIEPNMAVGKVRAGMTIQQVVAELGEPQRRTASALEYSRLGLAVLPGPDGIARVVMCGDVTGLRGPFVRAFTGRTKEGIGMNSTRDSIIKAYGEPAQSEKMPGAIESLQYPSLGMTFTLENDQVHHMIVRLRGAQEPDRTVTLESPPTAQH